VRYNYAGDVDLIVEPLRLLAERFTVNWIWTFLKKIIGGKGTKECGWDGFLRVTFSFFLPGILENSE